MEAAYAEGVEIFDASEEVEAEHAEGVEMFVEDAKSAMPGVCVEGLSAGKQVDNIVSALLRSETGEDGVDVQKEKNVVTGSQHYLKYAT